MKRILRTFRLAVVAALAALGALTLSGCAHVEPGVTQQTKVYRDAPVQ